jgi:hypothetical protein
MKKHLTFSRYIIVLAALFSIAPSHATVVNFDFKATIYDMFEYTALGSSYVHLTSSTFPGKLVTVGDTVTGHFSYDTVSQLSSYQPAPPATGTYQLFDSFGNTQFTVEQSGLQFASNNSTSPALLQLADNASNLFGWDIFHFNTYSGDDPSMFQNAVIALYDSTGTAISNSMIPSSLDLLSFHYANLDGGWLRQSNGDQFHFSASLTSLTPSRIDLPEPQTYMLMLVGLALLGTSLYRRKN